MDDKAMVECSTVGFRSLADGTVRFTVDVEPLNRDIALKAFSQPGTPCVLAVITKDVAKKTMVDNEAEKAKPTQCRQAIEYHKKHKKWPSNTADAICKEYNFYLYLEATHPSLNLTPDYNDLNETLKLLCDGISRKSELDTNHDAFITFEEMLIEYRKFVQENQT